MGRLAGRGPFLEAHERSARILHQELARDPEFFADVIAIVYRPQQQSGPAQAATEQERVRAQLGYQLLRSWSTVPGGSAASGSPGPGAVGAGHPRPADSAWSPPAGDQFIGQILSQTPDGSRGQCQLKTASVSGCRSNRFW